MIDRKSSRRPAAYASPSMVDSLPASSTLMTPASAKSNKLANKAGSTANPSNAKDVTEMADKLKYEVINNPTESGPSTTATPATGSIEGGSDEHNEGLLQSPSAVSKNTKDVKDVKELDAGQGAVPDSGEPVANPAAFEFNLALSGDWKELNLFCSVENASYQQLPKASPAVRRNAAKALVLILKYRNTLLPFAFLILGPARVLSFLLLLCFAAF
ncbi:hypothetical protein NA57DRAFT_56009 [Rhizodiscina lignyota]|uniref:Uncharacterized protein n=1 Tax=Rhizodiscina lignyota TaxID=1504668 RepID=A0A9P4IIW1_9PEZI|nr:hypothetical protein NA57DRAFT_56009 [Rhizodiscina lignyota]